MNVDPVSLAISTFPFIWLSFIYFLDYKLDYAEKCFFIRPLEKALSQVNEIRELCFGNLNAKKCPIFRNLDLCIMKNDFMPFCTYDPWFKPDDIKDPEGLARTLIHANSDNAPIYFLKHMIPSKRLDSVGALLRGNSKNNGSLKKCLADAFNDLIRDNFIYDEKVFENIDLGDSDIEEIAKIKSTQEEKKFKHLQLNSYIVERTFSKYLEPRLYVNRIWKLIRDGCLLSSMQAHFIEFIALEVLIVYINKYHASNIEGVGIFTLGLIAALLIAWGITISQGEPSYLFRDKRNRFLAAIAIWGLSSILIII